VHALLLFALVTADFTVVLLPDTQKYTESHPETFLAQTQWIRENVEREKIAFVIHLGDITENNTRSEWQLSSRAIAKLEGRVPFSLLPGNHDGYSKGRDAALYHQTFPPSRFAKYSCYGGHSGSTNENNYCVFRAAKILAQHPRPRAIIATHAYMCNNNTRLGPGDDYSPHKKSARREFLNHPNHDFKLPLRHVSVAQSR
jgi:3',5'-cyclic AMP phosphodiesterase CpdA